MVVVIFLAGLSHLWGLKSPRRQESIVIANLFWFICLQLDYEAFTLKVKHHKINVLPSGEHGLFQKMKIYSVFTESGLNTLTCEGTIAAIIDFSMQPPFSFVFPPLLWQMWLIRLASCCSKWYFWAVSHIHLSCFALKRWFFHSTKDKGGCQS